MKCDVHVCPLNCNNNGICDEHSFTCTCNKGYAGEACDIKECPNQCSG